jgi:hypothetical protein
MANPENPVADVYDAMGARPASTNAREGDGVAELRAIAAAIAKAGINGFGNQINDVADRLAAMQAQQGAEPVGWVPVGEQLPASSAQVLLIAVNPEEVNHNYTTDPYAGWITPEGKWCRWPHPFSPTHWQPLPAAPATGAPR